MKNNSSLTKYKNRLKTKETNFRQLLSIESNEFEDDLSKKLKQTGYVLAGLVAGYLTFKAVAPKSSHEPSKGNGEKKKKQSGTKSINATIKDKLAAFAVQVAISYASEKLKTKASDERDSKTSK